MVILSALVAILILVQLEANYRLGVIHFKLSLIEGLLKRQKESMASLLKLQTTEIRSLATILTRGAGGKSEPLQKRGSIPGET
jgi:hypothetical protein